jgi:hypothetical protein
MITASAVSPSFEKRISTPRIRSARVEKGGEWMPSKTTVMSWLRDLLYSASAEISA